MNNTKVLDYTDVVITNLKENSNYTNESVEVKPNDTLVTTSLCENQPKNKFSTYIYNFIKRLVDFSVGIIGAIFIIPLTIIIYISNKINKDDGPIFYVQERIGKNGKTFKMLKYRSMVVGAEEKLAEYLKNNKEAEKEYKIYKKLKKDPRITKIGGILRKTSLDEIPQLLHLIDGTMSLVGPRPYLTTERKEMGKYYDIIIKSKPRNYRIMANKWKIKCNI